MNKLFTKVAALTLGVAMAAGVGVAVGASQKASSAYAADEYELVKNVSSLSASDKVVIASAVSGNVYTMSTTQNNNNRGANGTFTVTNDKITVDSSTQVFTLGKDGDNFTFLTDSGYIYAASSSSNYLRTKTALDDNGKWSVSIAATGAATVVAQGTNTRNILKFNANNGNPIFSAYSTSGTVAIFKATTTPVGTQYDVTDSVENGSVLPSTVSEGATLTATITPDTGYNVPETVSVTMGGTAATHTYQNGVVTVENVTGDIVISGSCVAMPSPEHAGTLEDPYTVEDAYRAIDKGTGLANVYVRGITAGIVTSWSSQFNNISFNISDDGSTDKVLQAYRCISSEAHTIASDSDVPNGATVVMYGTLKKYGSTYELDQGCYIAAYTAPANPIIGLTPNSLEFIEGGEAKQVTVSYESFGAQPTITVEGTPAYVSCQVDGLTVTVTPTAIGNETVTIKGTNGTEVATADLTVSVSSSHGHVADDPYTVAEALAAPLSAEVYVAGKISAVTEVSTSHGNATYNISDDGQDTNSMIIYRGKYINGADFTDASQIEVGGTVVVKGQLTQYQSKNQLAAGNQLVSYVAPAPTAWTTEQEQTFKDNLDGYVPPYFAELSGDIEVYGTLVQYNVKSDVVAAFNSYYEQQGWESDVPGYWSHETTGGNGVVQAYAQTSATGALLSFQYTEYAVVTLDENGTKTEVKLVPPADYTLPSPTASLIPDGKEFKAWEIAGVEYQPDAKYSVSEDVTITAVYVDKAQTDWTDAQKAALETALHGYLPPFFGELAEEITTTENSVRFTVSGDISAEFATKLGDGWELIGTNNYMKTGDNYYLTASIYVEGVRLPVGDYSYIEFAYHEGGTWSADLLNQFATVLHGVVPSYDDSVSTLTYYENYKDFEMAATDQATAQAQLDTLCAGWTYYEAGGFYYTFSQDQLGYVRGYLYKESDTSYSATLVFVQTAYDEEQQDAFYDKLGVVPPFFTNFATYTFYETDEMFVTDQITYLTNLSNYQEEITGYGFTLMGQSAGQRYVKVAGEAMDGTVYAYGALLQDGGLLVVEIFAFYDYYLSINIYYQAQPVSIALSGEYKTTFEYGEQLDTTGMVVTATMSDETEQDVTSSAQFSGFDSLVEGEQTVTVTVGNASATYTVIVNEKVLQSIAVTSEPTKVVYKVGEEFDPEGLEVTATYNGGDPVVLDLADVEISGFDSSTTGEKTVTVAFGGKTASFTVTVEQGYDADAFAKDLLDKVAPICANYDGKKNNKAALKTVWDTMSQLYSTLSDEEKAKVIAAAAKADGTDLEKAMAFYNYACKKYGLTKFIEGRQVKALVTEHETGNSILPIVVIVASSVAAITAIGVVIALKRRKALLAK